MKLKVLYKGISTEEHKLFEFLSKLMTVEELAKYLKTNLSTIKYAIKKELIRPICSIYGKSYYYKEAVTIVYAKKIVESKPNKEFLKLLEAGH